MRSERASALLAMSFVISQIACLNFYPPALLRLHDVSPKPLEAWSQRRATATDPGVVTLVYCILARGRRQTVSSLRDLQSMGGFDTYVGALMEMK